MLSLVFNEHKRSLLNNELYYSHDKEQTQSIYRLVTQDLRSKDGLKMAQTCLFRDSVSSPVGEISLGSRASEHKVICGSRSIKPSASAFSGGLYVQMLDSQSRSYDLHALRFRSFYSADRKKYTWKDFAYGSWSVSQGYPITAVHALMLAGAAEATKFQARNC